MTRTQNDADLSRFGRELTAEERAERFGFDVAPRHRGLDGAVARIHELFGVDVTTHYLRRQTNSRHLASHQIGHVLHFSDRDLFDFVVLSTRRERREVGA